MGLAIGSDVQEYDADLAAIAGLTSAADKGIQFTGSGTAATFDLTTAGKALLDDANAADQRTTLGLGSAATFDSSNFATAAQGTTADNALPSSSVSTFGSSLIDDADAATARTTLGVDAAGTDNSTDVTLASVTSNYLTISNQEITAGTVPVSLGGTGATTASDARTNLGAQGTLSEGAFADGDKTKLDGIEAGADITDATNVTAAGAVMNTGDETIAGAKEFSTIITGNITGNAATASVASKATALNTITNGIVKTTNGDGTLSIGNLVSGDIPDNSANTSGNAGSVTNGVYTTDKLSALSETTSTELATKISDETGSGSLVFATLPTLVTPLLGTPQSGVLTNCTGYPTSSLSGTISNTQLAGSIANEKLSNSNITIAGTATSLGGTITADAIINAGTGISQSDADNGTTVIGASGGKVGFFGVTAVVQQSNIVDAASTQLAASGAPTESEFNGLLTDVQNLTGKVNAILTALEALGLLASS